MAKIISGEIHVYVRQLLSEMLDFEEIQGNVLENSQTSENPQNSYPKEGQQDQPESFQSSDTQRRGK